MSDWDFLHEMHDRGYSAQDIADAAGSGAAPWEWDYIAKQETQTELENLQRMRSFKEITREEFLKRKAQILR